MESMFGKFPLANRPKMTRRKRKNIHLAPGASSAASASGTRRGGNSPTMEPANNSADMPPIGSSYTGRNTTVAHPTSGAHRRVKGTQQSRRLKRGANPYNSWMPPDDNPSSPTTEETLPVTPQSDMSSTFSFSPSPGPSSRRPQSPVHRRRNAVSAGPQRTDFGFPTGSGFAPASAPLISTPTWPMSGTVGAQRHPQPTPGGLVQTRSDGALEPRSQPVGHVSNAGYSQNANGAPQITVSFNSHLTNNATPSYQPSRSFNQLSSSHTDSSFLAEQAFPWPDFPPTYPPNTTAQHHSFAPGDSFSLGSSSANTGYSDMAYVNYNEPYLGANETDQTHILGLSDSYDLSTENHIHDFSFAIRRTPGRPSQEAISLASLAFNHLSPTR
ncbi:hypothetical protein B0J17DRAFT_708760 [Rhizoctonia solani]|nr:hypothetical protein B0J17DRAFT_708760 [Rhizoctonia solani]